MLLLVIMNYETQKEVRSAPYHTTTINQINPGYKYEFLVSKISAFRVSLVHYLQLLSYIYIYLSIKRKLIAKLCWTKPQHVKVLR